ncbi:MAG: GldG family protein [Deltaproteobacteria bacterium]|nr:GldG family protein [Deltaproteobacteria bacterium]
MGGFSLKLKFGANVGLAVLLFLAILVVAGLIAEKHPYRIDLTKKGTHTLSPQTLKILAGLSEDVSLKAFYFEADQEKSETKDLFEAYQYASPKVKFEFVDPELRPAVVRKYDVKSAGTVVLEGYGKTQTVTLPTEESLTNALLKLTSSQEKKLYFLTGHGEHDIDDIERTGYTQLKDALEKENYKVEKLDLMRMEAVPEDAKVVVIAAPEKPLLEPEIQSLDAYLGKGGRILVMLMPFLDGGLTDMLASHGIALRKDIVVDTLSRAMGGDYLVPIISATGDSKIAENTRVSMLFPQTRSVLEAEAPPKDTTIQELLVTSPGSWAETDEAGLEKGEVGYDEGKDVPGPFSVGLLGTVKAPEKTDASNPVVEEDLKEPAQETGQETAQEEEEITEKEIEKETAKDQPAPGASDQPKSSDAASDDIQTAETPPEGKLIVYGNADFANNAMLAMLGNRDLILNTIGFLSEDQNLVSIRTKKEEMQTLTLNRNQSRLLFWVSLILVPGLVLLAGVATYRVRRRSK